MFHIAYNLEFTLSENVCTFIPSWGRSIGLRMIICDITTMQTFLVYILSIIKTVTSRLSLGPQERFEVQY